MCSSFHHCHQRNLCNHHRPTNTRCNRTLRHTETMNRLQTKDLGFKKWKNYSFSHFMILIENMWEWDLIISGIKKQYMISRSIGRSKNIIGLKLIANSNVNH